MMPEVFRKAAKRSLILAAVFVSAQSQAIAENPRSIVGWWGYPGANCAPAYGAISIEAMALWGDDVRCDFTSVVRKGATVTWKGKCSYGQGEEVEEQANETVIATEKGGKLKLNFGALKNDEPPLQRCNPNDVQ
jgi:hypothetical protein